MLAPRLLCLDPSHGISRLRYNTWWQVLIILLTTLVRRRPRGQISRIQGVQVLLLEVRCWRHRVNTRRVLWIFEFLLNRLSSDTKPVRCALDLAADVVVGFTVRMLVASDCHAAGVTECVA